MTVRGLRWPTIALAASMCWTHGVQARGSTVAGRQTAPAARQAPGNASSDLTEAIGKLGSFDLATRTAASRTVRRATPDAAVPALRRAIRESQDGYVQYRALVLLSGFGEPAASDAMRSALGDKNDRLRAVAYEWFEQHRDPNIVPSLIDALGRESSEFVRPALLRALAAKGDDARVRSAIAPLVLRGEDEFRGALIEALGDYHAAYAAPSIALVAKLDGPLQDDSVTALGKIGGDVARETLRALRQQGPPAIQPSVAAALCLQDVGRAANREYLEKSLAFAASTPGHEGLLEGAAHGLATLATDEDPSAFAVLLDAGIPSHDPARGAIGFAVGLVALRRPEIVLAALEGRQDSDGAITLLRDAFDMLSSEDYRLEQFYVAVRHAYWSAPDGSAQRRLADAVIQGLDF